MKKLLISLLLLLSAARADVVGLVDTDTGLGVDSDLRYMEVIWLFPPPYDETSNLSTGSAKLTIKLPMDVRLATGVERGAGCMVSTAPSGSTIIVDINDNGTSILSTKISIDAGETSSQTAASLPVVSDCCIVLGSTVTLDIDQVGSSTPGRGLKCWLLGHYE